MHSRILDSDYIGGRTTIHHWDPVSGRTTLEEKRDVTALLERNKGLFNSTAIADVARKHGFVMVASIPTNVWQELKKAGIVDDKKAFTRWLSDPENRFFRTASGGL